MLVDSGAILFCPQCHNNLFYKQDRLAYVKDSKTNQYNEIKKDTVLVCSKCGREIAINKDGQPII